MAYEHGIIRCDRVKTAGGAADRRDVGTRLRTAAKRKRRTASPTKATPTTTPKPMSTTATTSWSVPSVRFSSRVLVCVGLFRPSLAWIITPRLFFWLPGVRQHGYHAQWRVRAAPHAPGVQDAAQDHHRGKQPTFLASFFYFATAVNIFVVY